jgi:hypothetical protein
MTEREFWALRDRTPGPITPELRRIWRRRMFEAEQRRRAWEDSPEGRACAELDRPIQTEGD